MTVAKDEDLVHDEVVLLALERWEYINFEVERRGILTKQESRRAFYAVLEYAVGSKDDGDYGWVDLALLDEADTPVLLLEVKSKREPQSASGWTRQVRNYQRLTQVPCILVVAHDLAPWMKRYFRASSANWLDVRTVL